MTIESGSLNPTILEKTCKESLVNLQASGVPELFTWIGKNYNGCSVISNPGNPSQGEYPNVSLQGPWTKWGPIDKKIFPGIEVSDSAAIIVGFKEEKPFVIYARAHKKKRGINILDVGLRTRLFNFENTDDLRRPTTLVQFAGRKIEDFRLINPQGEEIDIVSLRVKVQELAQAR